jgi:hypothetical protein
MSARYAWVRVATALLGVVGTHVMSKPSFADEGGAAMYLSGAYGSLAAVPGEPGWSMALVYYHQKANLGTPFGYASERSDVVYGVPTYAFATPVLGGQLALSMASAIGRVQASVDAVAYDRQQGFDDLLPSATLRWGAGVNNYMVYGQGDVPIGTYDPLHLANFGTGHGGIDSGAGYTYFDQKAGNEFSAVAGLTYNLKNTWTEYQNGIDSHIDWGASKFLSKDFHIGAVGYYYAHAVAVEVAGGDDRKVGGDVADTGGRRDGRAVHEPYGGIAAGVAAQQVGCAVAVEVALSDDRPGRRQVAEPCRRSHAGAVHEPYGDVTVRVAPDDVADHIGVEVMRAH